MILDIKLPAEPHRSTLTQIKPWSSSLLRCGFGAVRFWPVATEPHCSARFHTASKRTVWQPKPTSAPHSTVRFSNTEIHTASYRRILQTRKTAPEHTVKSLEYNLRQHARWDHSLPSSYATSKSFSTTTSLICCQTPTLTLSAAYGAPLRVTLFLLLHWRLCKMTKS